MKSEENADAAKYPGEEDEVYETLDFTYLGDGGSPQLLTISRTMKAANPQLQRFDFEDSMVIYLREAGLVDGSLTNTCVSALVKGGGRFGWRGPLIVLGQPRTMLDPLIHRDLSQWIFASRSITYGHTMDYKSVPLKEFLPDTTQRAIWPRRVIGWVL